MTENNEIIDLLAAIVGTIESTDEKAQKAKSELLEQLKLLTSKTDVISTNFPKLIETLANFDNKIASSFDDIQNVSKQLNSVVEKVTIAEQAILNVQQQAQKLKLDSTLNSIHEADERAQQLNKHLNNSSTKYAENMSAATNIAIEQINKLKNEVNTIADSFSKIVSDKIADSVTSKVSKTLSDQFLTELGQQTKNLTASALKEITPQIQNLNKEIERSNQEHLARFNASREEVIKASEKSNDIYIAREKAYQEHVSKEKTVEKRNWVVVLVCVWFGFIATAGFVGHVIEKTAENTVDQAISFIRLRSELNNLGFSVEEKDYCQSLLPKEKFSITREPQVYSCFYLQKPDKEFTINNNRNLMIFTK